MIDPKKKPPADELRDVAVALGCDPEDHDDEDLLDMASDERPDPFDDPAGFAEDYVNRFFGGRPRQRGPGA